MGAYTYTLKETTLRATDGCVLVCTHVNVYYSNLCTCAEGGCVGIYTLHVRVFISLLSTCRENMCSRLIPDTDGHSVSTWELLDLNQSKAIQLT